MRITQLRQNEVFVFGSNLAGRHGKGAAKDARQLFGAVYGVGEGPTGQCYAIPTKDERIQTLPLNAIFRAVETFVDYAREHPEKRFLVTEIGCGLAGYSYDEMAPMFHPSPGNVQLPEAFL